MSWPIWFVPSGRVRLWNGGRIVWVRLVFS